MSNRLGRLAAAVLLLSPVAVWAAEKMPAYVTKAVTDSHRPDADTKRDADRAPAPALAFSGVKPGDTVAELIPGGGYMTRLLSAVVGPKGHVYAINWKAMPDRMKAALKPVTDDPAYANVSGLEVDPADFKVPERVDVVWTSMNYHDFKNMGALHADTAVLDKAIFDALKPGGVFILIDHSAEAGSGTRDTQTLHRIDPATVKAEVLAAGFKLDGQSDAQKNPADDHTKHSDDKSDKMFFKFRKP
jgi:predicted methyltransferase